MTTREADDFTMSVPQAGLRLGITSSRVYSAAQRGDIRTMLIDGRWKCSASSVESYRKRLRIDAPQAVSA